MKVIFQEILKTLLTKKNKTVFPDCYMKVNTSGEVVKNILSYSRFFHNINREWTFWIILRRTVLQLLLAKK